MDPSLARRAFAGAAWLSVMNGLGGVAMLGLTWWLNRHLADAPLRMGQWSVVLSLLLMTSMIFEGGLPAAIQQRKELDPNALGALAWIQVALGVAGGLALWLAAPLLARLMARDAGLDEMARLIRFTAPAVVTIALGLPAKALLQREMRFRAVGSVEASATLVTVVVTLLTVGRLGVLGLVVAINLRFVVETVAYWTLGPPPWSVLRHHGFAAAREPIRFGAAVGGTSVLGTLARQGDVLLVSYLLGPVAAGLYRQIQSLVLQPFAKLTTYVARAAYSAFAKAQDDPERLCRGLVRMQRLLSLLVLPLLFGMAAVSPRLLAEFLGEQYAELLPVAIPAMHLLCLAAAVLSYTFTFSVVLNASGASRAVLLRQAGGVVAMLACLLASAPWGLPGVAFGRIVALVVHGTLLLGLADRLVRFGRRQLGTSLKEALPASVACFAAASLLGLYLSRWWPASAATGPGAHSATALRVALLAQVAAGAMAYAAALLALRVNPLAEWRALRR